MKVLITSDSYLPRLGGAEIHAYKLGLFLQKEGHEVKLLTSESLWGVDPSPFEVVRIPYKRNFKSIFNFYRVIYQAMKWSEVVYSVYSYKLAAIIGIYKFFLRRPFLVSLEGLGTLDMPGNNWLYSMVHSFYRAVSIRRADVNLAASLEFVDIAKRYTSKGRVTYMPNALDVEEFYLRPKDLDLVPFELRGRKIVATIRRLVPKNGIQFLIEAIPFVLEKFDNVIFYIIGWGKLEIYLEKRVEELGIGDYVFFAGRIENDKLAGYLNLADLVIFPSTAEATSIACLESMALGKPILASKIGGYPEMVEEGVNGYLVNLTDSIHSVYSAPMTLPENKLRTFADKIVEMLSNDKLLNQFGKNSRRIAEEKFNWHIRIKEITSLMENLSGKQIKEFYKGFGDRIIEKRLYSPYKLRRYAHAQQYQSILKFVKSGMRVLDAGCGEGALSVMMAKKGAIVTGCDISRPNIERCKKYARAESVADINFVLADSDKLPFENNVFDLVVSSHVLEHLPDFDSGLNEAMRVTKNEAVVAIPTIFNLCSLVQAGKGMFWLKGQRSFLAIINGFLKTIAALIIGNEGVNESYSDTKLPHIFRFPWVLKKKLKKHGYKLRSYEASTICLPYFESLLPLIRLLDRFRTKPLLRNFGYGTTYLIGKD